MPRLRVVILDHNGGERTLDAVRSVLADGYSGARDVVLVDNASDVPVLDKVRAEFPEVITRRAERNLGFAGGCNLGIGDPSEVDLVALVNNDCIVSPGWLDPLVAAITADPKVGAAMPKVLLDGRFVAVRLTVRSGAAGTVRVHEAVVGDGEQVRLRSGFLGPEGATRRHSGFQRIEATALLYAPVREDGTGREPLHLALSARNACDVTIDAGGSTFEVAVGSEPRRVEVALEGPAVDLINSTGVILTDDARGADRGWLDVDDGHWDQPTAIEAWTGAAVLLRAEHLSDVGVFDESLFLYSEDLELSWRASRRGWRFRYVPQSTVRHLHSATAIEGSRLAVYHIERNRLLVLTRHAPARVACRFVARFVLVIASYARRDVVGAALRREPISTAATRVRLAALAGYLRRLPGALRSRRADRARLGPPMMLTPPE